jgi:hypothetical protein
MPAGGVRLDHGANGFLGTLQPGPFHVVDDAVEADDPGHDAPGIVRGMHDTRHQQRLVPAKQPGAALEGNLFTLPVPGTGP